MPATPSSPEPLTVAVVGAGPGGTSLVERLCANAAGLLGARPLRVHVVDPFPPGAGRVWRREQSPLLWANSLASDVTLFTDEASTCAGPIRPGPSLWEWGRARAAEFREGRPHATLLPFADELARLTPVSFPSRPLMSAYLAWVFRSAAAAAPPNVRVLVHRDRAVDLTDTVGPGPAPRQRLTLASGAQLTVDAVVLAQGHLDADPDPEEQRLAAYARDNGLVYVPRGYTADQDLDTLAPGAPVLVRGIGLAFVDLMVRVTSERGGRFERDGAGTLVYRPSGREPVLYPASRRGVPYRAKTGYELTGERPTGPQFFTVEAFDDRPGHGALEWERDLHPVLLRELEWSYYQRLFTAHGERTTGTWDDFATAFAAASGPAATAALVARTVPDAEDRLDLARLDRPLAGRRFADRDALQRALHGHLAADLARRSDARHSADLAMIHGLLAAYGVLARLLGTGRVADSAQAQGLPEFHGFFSYLASGPPGPRLEEMLALARAGVVRFLGADAAIAAIDGAFTARSPSVPGTVRAGALVDARLPEPSLARTRDPLLRRLYTRGDVSEQVLTGRATGKLATAPGTQRLIAADGTEHPARHAVGHGAAGGAAVGGFARPRLDAPAFRVNDALARTVLTRLAEGGGEAEPDAGTRAGAAATAPPEARDVA
ncbi:FAD/NAD(P)-binding protein [Yinghuangia seranimata]|uniref:FAD/NAD(P)-binding protein n=1 Tax=Yinghuangia seranimata TaxID=408067 RepID=UPI00248D1F4D|nr:FAD/NAD(P)-binding protein [Yinghuangia seranimata]MDI2132024.1 FAD/NAD(P)-binding protein [Yinghuangia seranimata]